LNEPVTGITGLEAISVAGSLAAFFGLPIAAWAILHEGRELRRELSKRAQIQFRLSGAALASETLIPSPGPHKHGFRHDPRPTDSADCTVVPTWNGQSRVSDPVVVSLLATNLGERSANKIVWNYTIPRTLISDDTLRSLRVDDVELDAESVRLFSRAESLHPGTSHQVRFPPLTFPMLPERVNYEVGVTLSQEDQPPRSVAFRLICDRATSRQGLPGDPLKDVG
jgi:hypothetical protein